MTYYYIYDIITLESLKINTMQLKFYTYLRSTEKLCDAWSLIMTNAVKHPWGSAKRTRLEKMADQIQFEYRRVGELRERYKHLQSSHKGPHDLTLLAPNRTGVVR